MRMMARVDEMSMAEAAPNEAKFRELLLYVAMKSEDDPGFGATKLNKILFFAEFIAYGKLGRPITGMAFQKLEFGPAARRLLPVQNEMEQAKDCAVQSREHFGREQKRLIALREPDLSGFSGPEIAIVDDVIEQLRGHNAVSVSDLSHRFLGWELADMHEDIPYETVFLNRRPLRPSELKIAEGIAHRRGEP